MRTRSRYTESEPRLFRRAAGACFACLLVAAVIVSPAAAEDWATYQHDNQRSGITSEELELPLHCNWVLTPKQMPQAAWEESPAKEDPWHDFRDLKPRTLFDKTNYVAVAGESMYFGSSADDMVCCVSASSGVEQWVFFTEGPVRFAPTVDNGKVYFGSDDGYAYCLNADDGELIWKYKPHPNDDLILGNGRMISVCPVRTSLVVEDGIVYFCAGVFPNEGVYMCALNADTGSIVWNNEMNISPSGYLLASSNDLYVPTGKTNPQVYRRSNGAKRGSFSHGRSGGTYALIVDDKIVSGPAYTDTASDYLLAYDTRNTGLVGYLNGNHVIVTPGVSYLHTDDNLSALDRAAYFKASEREVKAKERLEKIAEEMRKSRRASRDAEVDKLVEEASAMKAQIEESQTAQKAAVLWLVSCEHPYSLISAGGVLFAGGDNQVAAYNPQDGSVVWTGDVTGRAYGLAVSNGSLVVSTDRGTIHRFSQETGVTQWRTY